MSTDHVARAFELAAEHTTAELEAALQERRKLDARNQRALTRVFWITVLPLYVGNLFLLPSFMPSAAIRTFDYVFCALFMVIPVGLLAALITACICSAVLEDETVESEEALKIAIAAKKLAASQKPAEPAA